MKAWLSRAGVLFVAKNVDEDPEAYDELLARGFRSVPVTFFGESSVLGYDVAGLSQALAAWRS